MFKTSDVQILNCQDNSRLKVDLKKAQEACAELTEQLTKFEADSTDVKEQLASVSDELTVAREAKDQAIKVNILDF